MVYSGMKHWLFAAAITIAITMASVARAASADASLPLRLMTYNIRLDLASDGANAWANRRRWVAAQVLWLRPDIFGLQEVLPNQKADLIADLPQYRLFGGGRDGKEKGEASPVGYDIKRFDFSRAACSGCRRRRTCRRGPGTLPIPVSPPGCG